MIPPLVREAFLAFDSDAPFEGVKLEVFDGFALWEVSGTVRHQNAVARVRASFDPRGTGAIIFRDVSVEYPDGSLRRPDLSIWPSQPDEQDEPVRGVPLATIEFVAPGSERKDLELSPAFDLRMGVGTVVVLDPATGQVRHRRRAGEWEEQLSPVEMVFECGCVATV